MQIPRLVVRGWPARGENARAFLMDLAEVNGYPNYKWVLSSWSRFQSCGVLRGTDCDDARAHALARQGMADNLGSLMEGALKQIGLGTGAVVPARFVEHNCPKVCPACLAESSFLPSIWDLSLFHVCERHGIYLSDRCGACGDRIKWSPG